MGAVTAFYLGAGRSASLTAPSQGGRITYVSDPANPARFVLRPLRMDDAKQWRPWLGADQRFVDGRPGVLTFTGETLTAPVHMMGAPAVELYLATSGREFALYDRNPQRYVANIFEAKPADYQPATITVSYGGNEASAVWLPVAR